MSKRFKIKKPAVSPENLCYLGGWCVLFLAPLANMLFKDRINLQLLFLQTITTSSFLLIFLIHHHVLFEKYFLAKRHLMYFLLTLVLTAMVQVLLAMVPLNNIVQRMLGSSSGRTESLLQEELNVPLAPWIRPGGPPRDTQEHTDNTSAPVQSESKWGKKLPPLFPSENFGAPIFRDPARTYQTSIFHISSLALLERIILSLLIIAFNDAVRLLALWRLSEFKRLLLEKQKTEADLAFLRYQVNPHLVMNTLNNIHSLIDIDPELAKLTLIRFSQLLRYLLYQSNHGKVRLADELEFLRNYIGLFKIRLTDQTELKVDLPDYSGEARIYPLIFISYIENAFKHGVSTSNPSYIHISMQLQDGRMLLDVSNSSFPKRSAASDESGIGLANAKKRLHLLYNNNYSLTTAESNGAFMVSLSLPVYET